MANHPHDGAEQEEPHQGEIRPRVNIDENLAPAPHEITGGTTVEGNASAVLREIASGRIVDGNLRAVLREIVSDVSEIEQRDTVDGSQIRDRRGYGIGKGRQR